MASTVNTKLLDKFYEATNDRRFNPRLFGLHIATEGGVITSALFMQVVVGYLTAQSTDYLYGNDDSSTYGLVKQAHQMLEAYNKSVGIS
jgi:hypothetical protein